MNKFLIQAQEYAKSKNGTCLSTEYISAKKPLIFKCHKESHNSWSSLIYDLIKKNTWCPQCRDDESKNSHNEKFLKKAQEYAKKQNGTLISSEFINAKTKMEWRCNQEHHKSFFSTLDNCVNRNRWCPDCSINRPTWSTNKEIALQTAKENGGLVIFPKDVELIKTNTMLTWKCSNHEHQPWRATWRNVCENKTWCPECAGRFTKEEFVQKAHKFAKDNGGVCLTNIYENQNSRFIFKCAIPEHPEFEGSYKMIQTNVWCKECKKTSESVLKYKEKRLLEAKEHAESRGGKCLSTEFTTTDDYLIWKCHEQSHSSWKAKIHNIIGSNQRWCPECAGQLSPQKLLEKAQAYAKKNNGKVLTTNIKLAKDKVEWKCDVAQHSSWKVSLSSVLSQSTWCPACGTENYYMENSVRVILEQLLGIQFLKSRPVWNINPKTNQTLELDGYNEKKKIAFEFQGRHHFKQIFKRQLLEDVQFKDQQKIINCNANNVQLLIIVQQKKMYDLKTCINVVENYLKVNSIPFIPITDITNLELKISQLNRTKDTAQRFANAIQKAIDKGGECLSTGYINYSNKMKWKCSNELHQPWLATYHSVVKMQSWCPECAHKKPKFLD